MSGRTKTDEADLMAARNECYRLRRALQSADTRLMLHEAARTRGERPPKHVRGLAASREEQA